MSRRDKINNFEAGTILVHELDDCFSFDAGDEYGKLIFLTLGSKRRMYHDFDSGQDEEVNEGNAIDVFSGDLLSWGSHMFITIDEFIDWINNLRFIIDMNPELAAKIKRDVEQDFSICRFDKLPGMRVANAIIKHANQLLKGIETNRFKIPLNIRKAYGSLVKTSKINQADYYSEEINDLRNKLRYEELTTEEIVSINNRIDELNKLIRDTVTDATDEEINEMINNQLIPALRRIADIDPFDIISLTDEEERSYNKRKSSNNESESNEDSCEEDEDSYEPDEDSYDEDDRCEAISDAIEEAESGQD